MNPTTAATHSNDTTRTGRKVGKKLSSCDANVALKTAATAMPATIPLRIIGLLTRSLPVRYFMHFGLLFESSSSRGLLVGHLPYASRHTAAAATNPMTATHAAVPTAGIKQIAAARVEPGQVPALVEHRKAHHVPSHLDGASHLHLAHPA